MVDKLKKSKKGSISEEDVSALLESHSVNTILALLQEVSQVAGEKIDWNALVKNTATGISSVKEYQVLWHHLAYGKNSSGQLDNDSDPMDDDSDLEYELEAFPAVSREASQEAAACVKVLMSSGNLNDSHLSNSSTIEAPLTINIPNSKGSAAASDNSSLFNTGQGTNVCIAVTVEKQPLPSGTGVERRPSSGPSEVDLTSRKRRRGWSTEEDARLTAAVQKYGERNWANIARGDFKNDRKASELSQRWTSLKKKQGNSNVGTSSHLSESQLAAAHRAMSIALDMPMGDSLKATCQNSTSGAKSQFQSSKTLASRPDQLFRTAGPHKSLVPTKRLPMIPASNTDSMVKAAAVAAGARIATATDASSLIEATRLQNVVHIKTGASSVVKPSTTTITNHLPSNVHFIRNGLAKAPISSHSATSPNMTRSGESLHHQSLPAKSASSAVQPDVVSSGYVLNQSAAVTNEAPYIPSIEVAINAEDIVVTTLPDEVNDEVCDDQAEDIEKQQTSASGREALDEINLENQTSVSCSDQTQSDSVEANELGKRNSDLQRAVEECQENLNPKGRQEALLATTGKVGNEANLSDSTTTAEGKE